MKKFGLFIMVLGCVFASKANATHILELPDSGSDSHRIELLSSNVFDGQFYVWTYKVTSGAGSSIHALSHWVIGICDEYFDHAIDPGGTTISLISPPDTDPNLGISGLKFDDGYNDDEMRTVTIYMTQSLEVTQV
ncbi:MAG: hypothetical protein KC917_19995, partial [Candidatus Omnitrophica bacterium]|nr:hypothetical protein [Candidatus Omnitrophota bacterium]